MASVKPADLPVDRLLVTAQKTRRRAALCIAGVLTLAVALALVVPTSRTAEAAPHATRARSADVFVDSVGVNVHLHYSGTVYGRFGELIKPRLRELGVRHIRDGAYTYPAASADTFYYRRLRELGDMGVHANLLTAIDTPYTDRTDLSKLDDILAWTGGAVTSFEGANEPDLSGAPDWARQTRDLQRDMWETVTTDPRLDGVAVLGPTPVDDPGALGDLSRWTDHASWHPYPGGLCGGCSDVYGNSFDTRVARYTAPTGDAPLVATETGYHNAVEGPQDHRPASERAAGKYVPRLLFEHFNRGVVRSYLYELIDVRNDPARTQRNHNFGLLRNDGSRKPAFVALRNLLTLLDDPGPAFAPSSLAYGLSGETDRVHHTLLQKRDGSFWLALWQSRSSYDTGQRANRADDVDARTDIAVPDQRVAVKLTVPAERVALYRPNTGTGIRGRWTDTASVTIDVADEVALLAITTPEGRPEADPVAGTPPDEPAQGRPSNEQQPGPTPGAPTPPVLEIAEACDGAGAAFVDVPADHPFRTEISCLRAWAVSRGSAAGRSFEPTRPLPRWEMAVFVDRVAQLRTDGPRGPAPTTGRNFNDISALSEEARRAITRMRALGVINGTDQRTFEPHRRVTRAQVAAFLDRLRAAETLTTGPPADYFTDDRSSVHEDHINALTAAGVIQGSGNGRYRPTATVSRGAMAVMLARYLQLKIDQGVLDADARN